MSKQTYPGHHPEDKMTPEIDDETLMALADDELDPSRADALRRAIAADPSLEARFRRFSETREALSVLRIARDEEDPLAARIRAAAASQRAESANLNRRPLLAVASAAIVALGLGTWWLSRPLDGIPAVERAALDTLPSGETQALPDGATLAMIASFDTGRDGFCREYEVATPETSRITLACRGETGWQQRFAVSTSRDDAYRPASGEDALADALASISAGSPLAPEEEAARLGAE